MTGEAKDAAKVETALPRSRSRSRSATKSRLKTGPTILEVLNCKKDLDDDKPLVPVIKTFASIASRPPSPKATHYTATEAAIAAATDELAAAIAKHSADFHALLTSSSMKRTPARENRIRADNVALMTAATIRVQQAGVTHIALERLYEIARQEEGAVMQKLEKAPAIIHADLGGSKTTKSLVTDSEGFFAINRRNRSPLLTGNTAPVPGGKVRVNLFTEDFQKAGEDDLKEYSLDPSSRQPTKKAFRGDESSLVTAAVSTSSARSPARASRFTKKRVTLASPAKFGTGTLAAPKILPSEVRKQVVVRTMEVEEMELSMEEYMTTQKVKMAPLERVVNKEEQESLAKEAARLIRIKGKEEHYAGIAQAKVARELTEQIGHRQATGDDEDNNTTDEDGLDPGGIYSRQSNEDGSFSYHNSEASTADEYEEEFGEGASGCSPLVMGHYEPDEELELDSFEWMKEVESRGTFDKAYLLAEPINRIFPCVACKDQKNILDHSTWVPAFLRKSSAMTWDVLNVDFNHMVHDLEWEGDDGLENLWGLYYIFPDAQFMQSYNSHSTTKECMVLDAHPISDDATTAATTFSSSMTSLTTGTSNSSSTDALIEYNQDFQNALGKHRDDILCLIRKSATHGKPAIPTKMIVKIREANLATMTNKEASRHGGKELSLRKMKELGAQAEKEATAMFAAKTKQNSTMEQDDLPLANAQLQPPAPTFTAQWAPNLAPGFRLAQMELDGNCFYRSVSDQLFRDQENGHVIVCHQINNHIRRNGEKFKHFLLLNDSNLGYIERMGQDGAWAGHPEIYAAAMCYKVDVTIYSRDYTEIGGSLVFTDAGATEEVVRDRPMIYISYHDNNHFNSVRPPISSQSIGRTVLTGTERLEADMERAINNHQDEVGQAIAMNTTENGPMLPEEKINPIRENSRKIMSYIAHQLSSADGRCVSEAQLKESRDQAEVRALGTVQKDAEEAPTPPADPTLISALSPLQGMVAQYEADLTNIISNHRDGIASILREVSPTKENSSILAS